MYLAISQIQGSQSSQGSFVSLDQSMKLILILINDIFKLIKEPWAIPYIALYYQYLNCQALVPSPVPLVPNPNPKKSQIQI